MKDLIDFSQEMAWLIDFGVTVHQILWVEISQFSRVEILLMIAHNPKIHSVFWKLNKIFQMHLNIFSRLWLIFCCHHQKIQNIHFGHLNDHNCRSKMTPFIIYSLNSMGQIQFHWSPLFIMFWSVKFKFTY